VKKMQILIVMLLALNVQVSICNANNLYLSSVIGKGEYGEKIGKVSEATFRNPYGIAFDKNNNLYIVDSKNNMIKKVVNSVVSTVTGSVKLYDTKGLPMGGFKEGVLKSAEFNEPRNITINAKGEFIVSDTNNNLIRLVSSSKVTTLSGTGEAGYLDGKNTVSKFNKPTGVAMDADGNIFIADTGNNVIRKISTKLEVTTFAGKYSENGAYADGDAQTALFNEPSYIYVSGSTIYVVDSGNHAIRKIEDGKVTTVAGHIFYNDIDNVYAMSGDVNLDAKHSKFNYPKAMTVLDDGTIIIADTWNKKIKYISKLGKIEEFKLLKKMQDGSIENVNISGPIDVVENAGKLYVSDVWDNCIYVFDIENEEGSSQILDIKDKIVYKGIVTDIPVVSDNVNVLVPIRKFFENSQATVDWVAETSEAIVKIEDREYKFKIDNVNVKLMNSSMMVGLKHLKNEYKVDILYDNASNTIFAY